MDLQNMRLSSHISVSGCAALRQSLFLNWSACAYRSHCDSHSFLKGLAASTPLLWQYQFLKYKEIQSGSVFLCSLISSTMALYSGGSESSSCGFEAAAWLGAELASPCSGGSGATPVLLVSRDDAAVQFLLLLLECVFDLFPF